MNGNKDLEKFNRKLKREEFLRDYGNTIASIVILIFIAIFFIVEFSVH